MACRCVAADAAPHLAHSGQRGQSRRRHAPVWFTLVSSFSACVYSARKRWRVCVWNRRWGRPLHREVSIKARCELVNHSLRWPAAPSGDDEQHHGVKHGFFPSAAKTCFKVCLSSEEFLICSELWFKHLCPLPLFVLRCPRLSRWLTAARFPVTGGKCEDLQDPPLFSLPLCNFTLPVDSAPVSEERLLSCFHPRRAAACQQFDKCTSRLLPSTKAVPPTGSWMAELMIMRLL